ncbi:YcjF family protein [Massilia agilis]|uniref:YcjF family protein n=1 Tax=Massilia agilis TaxID=1811226 RepID=A0ABT2DCX8_9BURK|nr:YcjF family protein [Massilia agilis]MCS0809096.1 YcjF family protein [Massilia agilis]
MKENLDWELMPASGTEIARVREQCRKLVRKRAAVSAGIAAVPLPGVDLLSDLTTFALLIEEINKAFGLTPAQIDKLQPRMRIAVYEATAAIGGMLVGKIVTRELVLQVFKKSGLKLAAKSVSRFVPLAGQVASAAIGYALFQKMGYQHIEACAKVVEKAAGSKPV